MPTIINIHGTRFYLNGRLTYEGVLYRGKAIGGLLFNNRMVQAIFDDANPATAPQWRYPDTGVWDPDRNTAEFCAALAEYRRHGLLAVTAGLQGGGSVYTPDIYDHFVNSAYEPDGTLKPAYFDRLLRVIEAADAAGMVVIVNYFYWKHAARLQGERVVERVTEQVTDWLLRTGHENLLVDVANEAGDWWGQPLFSAQNIHRLIALVQGMALNGRRLLAGASTGGGTALPEGRWREIEDFHMPHGNGLRPDELRAKLQRLKETDEFKRHPRPILVNEDSVFVENLEAAIDEYASWGFYHQGFGSHYRDLTDWTAHERERRYEDLSGYQTVPVNWGINDPYKRAFFERLKTITDGR
ncbi:MAG: hypothetical protein M1546_12730 [Chloroflexi bacterium]|nr:hypothetical protein [Chloroflexota bacterium]